MQKKHVVTHKTEGGERASHARRGGGRGKKKRKIQAGDLVHALSQNRTLAPGGGGVGHSKNLDGRVRKSRNAGGEKIWTLTCEKKRTREKGVVQGKGERECYSSLQPFRRLPGLRNSSLREGTDRHQHTTGRVERRGLGKMEAGGTARLSFMKIGNTNDGPFYRGT